MKSVIINYFSFKFILATVTLGTILEVFEKYIFSDFQYLFFLIILIIVDTILGVVKHWMAHTVSSSGFGKFAVKILIYACCLVTVHVLTSFTVNHSHTKIFDWLDVTLLSALMLRESISIFENIAVINPDIVPRWVLKRLKDFDSQTGKKISNESKLQ